MQIADGWPVRAHRALSSCGLRLLVVLSFPCSVYAQAQNTVPFGVMDAVSSIIARNPDIQLSQQQAEVSRGGYRAAVGQFDPRLQFSLTRTRDNSPLSLANRVALGQSALSSNITIYRLSLDKPYRWGMTVSPGLEFIRNDILSISTAPTTNQARVSVRFTQPFLRGFGPQATTAQENATQLEYQAGRLDYRHSTGLQIASGVVAYWNYLTAYRNLEILREAESRAQTLATETQALIEVDEAPAAEYTQLAANLADKTTARIRGEQALVEARYALGQAMGLPFEQIPGLAVPTDAFPALPENGIDPPEGQQAYIDIALRRRADLLAADYRQRAAIRRQEAAAQNRLPNLNLTLDVGYASLQEGNQFSRYFSPLTQDRTGLNVSAALSYDWPIPNNSARGLADQQEAILQQRDIQTADLRRRVSTGVAVAFNALQNRMQELRFAQDAVRLYRDAVDNEKEKFRLGVSTLLDVINLEDRLRSARLNEAASQVGYATALVQLRFEAGLLVSPDGDTVTINREDLTTVPLTP